MHNFLKFHIALALSVFLAFSGPTQIDHIAPKATDQMVDPATGDFTYQINLGPVNSPAGKMFDLNLVYKAGIKYNQEASWVGLGWSLSVGAINRTVVGYPDDYRDENVRSFVPQPDNGADVVMGNPLGFGHPIVLSGSYPNDRRPRGTSFRNTLNRGVNGYLYSSPGAMLYRVDTYNSVLEAIMGNNSSSWTYGSPRIANSGKSPSAPEIPLRPRVLEYLEYNGFNLPAQDHYVVSAPGLSGEFKPFSYSSVQTFFSSDPTKNGNIGKLVNGQIAPGDLWNKNPGKFSPEFGNGFAFKMTSEGALNLVDNCSNDYSPSLNYKSNSGVGHVAGTRIIPIWDPDDKLGGFVLTKQDGTNYYFTLPLYSYQHISYSTTMIGAHHYEFPPTYGTADFEHGSFHEDLGAHAYCWLLTAITGPDYIKKVTQGHGWDTHERLLPHDGDLGSWATLRYGFSNIDDQGEEIEKAVYAWRDPYATIVGNAWHRSRCTLNGRRTFYTQFGLREVTYLKSIETPSDVISFQTTQRRDNNGINYEERYPRTPSWTDDRWAAFENGKHFLSTTKQLSQVTWFPKCQQTIIDGGMSYKELRDSKVAPHRTVSFGCDYSLGKNTPNSNSAEKGRLTLKKIRIHGTNSRKMSYEFGYQLADKSYSEYIELDHWGFTKSVAPGTPQAGLLWNLDRIVSPNGSEIKIAYERDLMQSVHGTLLAMDASEKCPSNGTLRYDIDNSQGFYNVYSVTDYDGERRITVNGDPQGDIKKGNYLIAELVGTYTDANANRVKVTNNDYIYRIDGIEGKTIILTNRIPFEQAKAEPYSQQVFTKNSLKRVYVLKERTFTGQGLRVKNVTTSPLIGKNVKLKYGYASPAAVGALPDLGALPALFRSPGIRGEGRLPSYSGVRYNFNNYESGPFKIDATRNGLPRVWSKIEDLPQEGSYSVIQKYDYSGHSFLSMTAEWSSPGSYSSNKNWDKVLSCVEYDRSSAGSWEHCEDYYDEARGCSDELIFHVHGFGPRGKIEFTRNEGIRLSSSAPVPEPSEGKCKYKFTEINKESPIQADERDPVLKEKLFYGVDLQKYLPWVDGEKSISIPSFTPGRYKVALAYFSESDGFFRLDGKTIPYSRTLQKRTHTCKLNKESYTGEYMYMSGGSWVSSPLDINSFKLTATTGVWIEQILLIAIGGMALEADWRTMRYNAFHENAVGLSDNMTKAYYPRVSVTKVDKENNAVSGHTVYDHYTANDFYDGGGLSQERIEEATPKLMQVVDYTALIGKRRQIEYHSDGPLGLQKRISYDYAFGPELANKTEEKYRGVFCGGTSHNHALPPEKAMGVVVERSMRLEPDITGVFEHVKLHPYLSGVRTISDGVMTEQTPRLFDARTGTPTVQVYSGGAKMKRITLRQPYLFIEPHLSRKADLESKNLYDLNGGGAVSDFVGEFTCIDDLTDACCTQEEAADYDGRIRKADATILSLDPLEHHNSPKYGQTRYFTSKTLAWKGGSSFNWPLESSIGGWHSLQSVIEVDDYLRVRTAIDAAGTEITAIHHPRAPLSVGAVKNADWLECGVLTGEYDMGIEGYFDKTNGWEKSGAILAEPPKLLYGENAIYVDLPVNSKKFGPGRNMAVLPNTDYILSAWVLVQEGSLVMHGDYRYRNSGGRFPIEVSGMKKEFSVEPASAAQSSNWQYMELRIPVSQDLTAENWATQSLWAARVYVGAPNGVKAYIQDVRFYPADAVMTSHYYDQTHRLPTLSLDAGAKPGEKITYDGFGRPRLWQKARYSNGELTKWVNLKKNEYHLARGYGIYHNSFEDDDPMFVTDPHECSNCVTTNGVPGGKTGNCALLSFPLNDNGGYLIGNRFRLRIPHADVLNEGETWVAGHFKLNSGVELRIALIVYDATGYHVGDIKSIFGNGDWKGFQYNANFEDVSEIREAYFLVRLYTPAPTKMYMDEISVETKN